MKISKVTRNDSKLYFEPYVNAVCLNASQKKYALARVPKFAKTESYYESICNISI